MRLDKETQHLTAFITPFGRYVCERLPFGICSAPEIFVREMQKALEGLEGVTCQMDYVLIYAEDKEEHDRRLEKVLERLERSGITLNPEKCEFGQTEVKFLGHIINQEGIHADPEKTRAIKEFAGPRERKDLQRFFGMVNYLGKFSPSLADGSYALRQLLQKDTDWIWGPD